MKPSVLFSPFQRPYLAMLLTILIGLGVAFVVVTVVTYQDVQSYRRVMSASNSAREIVIAMKSYAGDDLGLNAQAPLPSSNQVLRKLFQGGYLKAEDEYLFAPPDLGYKADGQLGESPDYAEALHPGENAWALVGQTSDSSRSNTPLIFLAPDIPSWPPVWKQRGLIKGRTIIGLCDGSVEGCMPGQANDQAFPPDDPHPILMPEQ
jgi:hypothetical protein